MKERRRPGRMVDLRIRVVERPAGDAVERIRSSLREEDILLSWEHHEIEVILASTRPADVERSVVPRLRQRLQPADCSFVIDGFPALA